MKQPYNTALDMRLSCDEESFGDSVSIGHFPCGVAHDRLDDRAGVPQLGLRDLQFSNISAERSAMPQLNIGFFLISSAQTAHPACKRR